MADIIKIKRSSDSGVEPSVLHEGELAANLVDKKLWIGDSGETPQNLTDKSLNDLIDVNVPTPAANDRLGWDTDTETWVNKRSLSALGIMEFEYSITLPTDTTPSARHISRDNSDPAQTTILYLHERDQSNADISLFIDEMRAGDWLNLHKKRDTEVYEKYDIINNPVKNGDVWEIPVTPYGNDGSINNGDRVRLFWRLQGQDTDNYREPMVSGIHHGGKITKGTGDLEILVEEGRGIIVDATTDPFKIERTDILWNAQTLTATPESNNSQELHMVYIDNTSAIKITPAQNLSYNLIYDYIRLGWIEISNNKIVSCVAAPNAVGQNGANLSDIFRHLPESAKGEGLRLMPCINDLSIYCTKGKLVVPGINWYNDRKNQNAYVVNQEGDINTPIEFNVIDQNANSYGTESVMPKYYDDGGTQTPLTGGEAVIHYMYFSTCGFTLQLGSKKYSSFNDAFHYADLDKEYFPYAPCAKHSGRTILIAQIIVSKIAHTFKNRSLALIISTISGDSGNTVTPIDLTLVPQYLLTTEAAEDLSIGDELSMDVNGHVQKYPATGGEGESEFTTDNVIIHSAVSLNPSNNQGIIAWIKDGEAKIHFRTAQGNANGSITYSPIASYDTNGVSVAMRICKIDSTRAGLIFSDNNGVHLGIITNNGTGSAPGISTIRTLDGGVSVSKGVDCVWDYEKNNLIGVFSVGNTVYNRHCYVSGGSNIDNPAANRISMVNGSQVRCVSEGSNIIVTAIDGSNSKWREAAWKKPFWGTGKYDDLTNESVVSNCIEHCGLQAQTGNILSQFKYDGNLITYIATYSSGSSMNTPSLYSDPISGKWGDLLKTDSGIGYSIILNDDNRIEIFEGTIQGKYELNYTSSVIVDSSNTEIQALMFGSVFAFGVGYNFTDSKKVFLVDSTVTRTDHFIGVSPMDVSQGSRFDVDIALPLITLPREYPPGTFYHYGPYKYQVIAPTQAVIIIESTIMQNGVVS